MNAISQAALTFTGQHVGAGNIHKIHKVMLSSILIVSCIGLVMGCALFLFGQPLLEIYLPTTPEAPNNPLAVQYGIERLAIVSTMYFLCGIMDAIVGCLRGMGSSLAPMITSLMGCCVLRVVWVLCIFPFYRTLFMLYMSYPISWFITSLVHFFFYFRTYRKLKAAHTVSPQSAA